MKAQATTEFMIALGFVMGIFIVLGVLINNMFLSDSFSYDASKLLLDDLESKINFLNSSSNDVMIPFTFPTEIDGQPYSISIQEDMGSKETVVEIVLEGSGTIASERMYVFKESTSDMINATKGAFIFKKNSTGIVVI